MRHFRDWETFLDDAIDRVLSMDWAANSGKRNCVKCGNIAEHTHTLTTDDEKIEYYKCNTCGHENVVD